MKDTYQKILDGYEVKGIPTLIRVIRHSPQFNQEQATKEVDDLLQLLQNGTSTVTSPVKETDEQYDERLAKERLTEKDRDFVIEVMTKQAPYDKVSILQLFHGYNSAFTKCPIPHIVNSRDAGAGKTYLSSFVVGYYPQKYVLAFAGASDKALFHKDGIMVIPKINNETGEEEVEPIAPIISELKSQKNILEKQDTSDNKIKIKEIEEEIDDIESRAEKLIILDNTIFLFLDTPQEALISALFTLISQDIPRDQKYFFADKSAFGRIGSKFNRLRGSPAIFTTRVLDDTRGERFAEKNRRFINVNPDTTAKKIRYANELIGLKYGCLPEQFDDLVVSRKDVEKAKHIVSVMIAKLKQQSKNLKPKNPGIYIPTPLIRAISRSIQVAEHKVWSMTIMERLMRYLGIIVKEKMDYRPQMVDNETGQCLPIATFNDLQETLQLMEIVASSVRPYQVDWFNNCFLKAFESLSTENVKMIMEDGKEVILKENCIGLTAQQLRDYMKKDSNETLSSHALLDKYIYPLLNHGIIDKVKSVIDRRTWIYFPTQDSAEGIFSLFKDSSDPRLEILSDEDIRHRNYSIRQSSDGVSPTNDEYCSVSVDLTTESFEKLIKEDISRCLEKYYVQNGKSRYKLIFDEKEISVSQVCTEYFSNPEACFKMRETSGNDEKSVDIFKDVSNSNTGLGVTSVNFNRVKMPKLGCNITSDVTVEQRRAKIQELIGEGYSRRKVAQMLNISHMTVTRDLEGCNIDMYKNCNTHP